MDGISSIQSSSKLPLDLNHNQIQSFTSIMFQVSFAMLTPVQLWNLTKWLFMFVRGEDCPFLVCDWTMARHREESLSTLARFWNSLLEALNLGNLRFLWLVPISRALDLALRGHHNGWTLERLRTEFDASELWTGVSVIPHCAQVPLRQIPMQLHESVLLASDVLHDLVQFSQEDDRIGDRCVTAALTAAWGVTLDLDGLCSFRYHPPQRASRLGLITTTSGL